MDARLTVCLGRQGSGGCAVLVHRDSGAAWITTRSVEGCGGSDCHRSYRAPFVELDSVPTMLHIVPSTRSSGYNASRSVQRRRHGAIHTIELRSERHPSTSPCRRLRLGII